MALLIRLSIKHSKLGGFDLPPVVAFVVTYATAITVGTAVVGTVLSISNAKKSAKKMEDTMRRMEEAQAEADRQAALLAAQESISAGVGGSSESERQDTKTMLKSTKTNRNVVFGRDRVSGPMMGFFSWETSGVQYHRFTVVLAGHECDAIETVFFEEDALTLDTNGWVVAPEKYTDKGRPLFFIEKKLGGAGQTASTYMMDAATFSGNSNAWTAARKGEHVCYLMVHMEAHYDTLKEVGLPNVSAIVRGVKAYDPRTMTTAWTRNPALLARWWLVDSIYTPPITSDEIDNAELIASANVCDESVAFSATVTAARYCADGTINTGANPLENLNKILGAMDGDAVWIAGKWQIIAGYHKAPTLHIDEASLGEGQINIAPYTPTSQLVNMISGQFKGPDTKYQSTGYPTVAPSEYKVEDGGYEYERKDDFDLVNDAVRCQMIAWQRLSRARQQLAINLDCNLKAYNTSPLQNITLSLSEFGYVNKIFNVRKRVFSGSHIEYYLQETNSAVWNWNYLQANAIVDTPNINIAYDKFPAKLENIVITSGTNELTIDKDGTVRSRMKVTWDLPTSRSVLYGGQIEWQYRRIEDSGAGAWLNAPYVAGDNNVVYIEPVTDGGLYELRGRAISQVGTNGVPSDIIPHTVIGKTEPPSNVPVLRISGQTLTWTAVTDLDLAGYVLRFNYGSNAAWSNATPINNGVLTQSPFDWTQRPSGAVTILIKAVDTTGNESLAATVVYTDLGDAFIANVVEDICFHPTFAGTITNATISGGSLIADTTTAFYPAGNQPMYPSGLLPFYPASQYLSMSYTTEWTYISSVLAGSNMTLDLDYVGDALNIEYRTQNNEPMFGGDELEAFYQPDADPFYEDSEGDWLPWPGQITAANGVYQFRVTIGSGETQGRINSMCTVIDAPDMEETINDLSLAIGGTTLPYTKSFTVIKGIQATLQSGSSGAVNILTNKTNPLAPIATAVDSTLTAVAGASGDFTLKGY